MPVAKNLRAAHDTPPSSGQGRNHAIRKSYSVGVVANKTPDQSATGLFIAHYLWICIIFPVKVKRNVGDLKNLMILC